MTFSLSHHLQILRCGVVILLGSLICIIGTSSYFLLRSNELKNFVQVIDSLGDLTSQSISSRIESKVLASSALSLAFLAVNGLPEYGVLPNITVAAFDAAMQPFVKLSELENIGYMPILTNKTRSGWETYAKLHIQELRGPDSLKCSTDTDWSICDGVYRIDDSGKKVYDTGNFAGSEYPYILAPVWQIAPIEYYGSTVMYNMHSERTRAKAIDAVISYKSNSITDLIQIPSSLKTTSPVSILFTPILTSSGGTIPGLIFSTFSWDGMLDHSLPSYMEGVYMVLTTSTQTYTFFVCDRGVTFLGAGDQHDGGYDKFRRVISPELSSLLLASEINYKIEMYPTKEIYDHFITATPGIACGTAVALIVVTSLVVIFYDFIIRGRQKELVEELVFSNLKSKVSDLAMRELDMKSSFIRYVSHEVRNPLNIVALGLDHLKRQISEENKEAVDVIAELESATKQAVEIMDNLLTFEKLTSNILELQKVEVSVGDYVEDNVQLMYIQARHKGVHLRLQFDEILRNSSCYVNVDKLKINQVIRNLLSNAIRFSPPGKEVVVRVSVARPDDSMYTNTLNVVHNRSILRLEVVDEGSGISMENQKRLFREVVEFTPGEFHDGKGSGLSLWISHQIVTMHQGLLYVYSEGIGKGATFTVELPIARGARPVPTSSSHDQLSSEARSKGLLSYFTGKMSLQKRPTPSFRYTRENQSHGIFSGFKMDLGKAVGGDGIHLEDLREEFHSELQPEENSILSDEKTAETNSCFEKILVVDDVLMNRKMLTRVLEQRWKDISCAEDGKVASDMVREAASSGEAYDIVLMDFEMPVMNGPDAAKVMRSEGYMGLIIGVTGNGLPVDIEHFMQQGADRVLLKPVSMKKLEDCISSESNTIDE